MPPVPGDTTVPIIDTGVVNRLVAHLGGTLQRLEQLGAPEEEKERVRGLLVQLINDLRAGLEAEDDLDTWVLSVAPTFRVLTPLLTAVFVMDGTGNGACYYRRSEEGPLICIYTDAATCAAAGGRFFPGELCAPPPPD